MSLHSFFEILTYLLEILSYNTLPILALTFIFYLILTNLFENPVVHVSNVLAQIGRMTLLLTLAIARLCSPVITWAMSCVVKSYKNVIWLLHAKTTERNLRSALQCLELSLSWAQDEKRSADRALQDLQKAHQALAAQYDECTSTKSYDEAAERAWTTTLQEQVERLDAYEGKMRAKDKAIESLEKQLKEQYACRTCDKANAEKEKAHRQMKKDHQLMKTKRTKDSCNTKVLELEASTKEITEACTVKVLQLEADAKTTTETCNAKVFALEAENGKLNGAAKETSKGYQRTRKYLQLTLSKVTKLRKASRSKRAKSENVAAQQQEKATALRKELDDQKEAAKKLQGRVDDLEAVNAAQQMEIAEDQQDRKEEQSALAEAAKDVEAANKAKELAGKELQTSKENAKALAASNEAVKAELAILKDKLDTLEQEAEKAKAAETAPTQPEIAEFDSAMADVAATEERAPEVPPRDAPMTDVTVPEQSEVDSAREDAEMVDDSPLDLCQSEKRALEAQLQQRLILHQRTCSEFEKERKSHADFRADVNANFAKRVEAAAKKEVSKAAAQHIEELAGVNKLLEQARAGRRAMEKKVKACEEVNGELLTAAEGRRSQQGLGPCCVAHNERWKKHLEVTTKDFEAALRTKEAGVQQRLKDQEKRFNDIFDDAKVEWQIEFRQKLDGAEQASKIACLQRMVALEPMNTELQLELAALQTAGAGASGEAKGKRRLDSGEESTAKKGRRKEEGGGETH